MWTLQQNSVLEKMGKHAERSRDTLHKQPGKVGGNEEFILVALAIWRMRKSHLFAEKLCASLFCFFFLKFVGTAVVESLRLKDFVLCTHQTSSTNRTENRKVVCEMV